MHSKAPFDFPKQIRLGILVTAFLIIVLELVILFFDFSIFTPDQRVSLREWDAFKAKILDAEQKDSTSKSLSVSHPASKRGKGIAGKAALPRFFDPNRLDGEGWMALGFSKRQAQSILKYRRSLGGFENKAQIQRSYVIRAKKFAEIEPFIRFSKPAETSEKPQKLNSATRSEGTAYKTFDLNTVSLSDLKALPPLHRVAPALITYREMLGGYMRFSQLDEVYHMDSASLAFLSRYARIDPTKIRRMDINRVGFKTLLRHPYFDYDMVEQIFQLRRGGGRFQNVEQLRKLPAFRGKDFDKIRLYLKPNLIAE